MDHLRSTVRIGCDSPRLWLCAIVALTWVMVGGATSASAQCTGQCADQESLLAPFNALLDTPAGIAVLDANLQIQNDIYLNSTQAQKIAAGPILILSAVPANLLLRAFPANPNFGYTSEGMPSAPALPSSVAIAVVDILGNAQIVAIKPAFGTADVYTRAYGLLPGQTDSLGNPPPYQVSNAILSHPFTPANASLLAYQAQQTPLYGVNWALGDSGVGDFPSAHTLLSGITALTWAVLAPGYYQQLLQGQAEFAYDLNVYAAHYPTDVIGGRILATYVVGQTLSGNPLYPQGSATPGNLAAISPAMQSYLGGGGSSPLCGAVRRQRRRLRGRRRDPVGRQLRPAEPELYFVPDLRPAAGRRHRPAADRAGGRVVVDRHALSLPERGAARPGPRHHRTAFRRGASTTAPAGRGSTSTPPPAATARSPATSR